MTVTSWLASTWGGGLLTGIIFGVVVTMYRVRIYNYLYDKFRGEKKRQH